MNKCKYSFIIIPKEKSIDFKRIQVLGIASSHGYMKP